MNQFISVLMPVYNSEKFVENSIKSILNQTHKDFEFLIIDSSSTDKTAEIIASFKDKRIIYFNIPRCPLSESLNFGIKKAKFKFIARMDSDDISLPNRFEIQMKYFSNDPTIDVLSCRYFYFKNNFKYKFVLPTKHEDILKNLALHSVLNHPGVIYKKSIISNYLYDNVVVEDYDLWLRLKDTVKFANTTEYLMNIYHRNNSLQYSNLFGFKNNVYQLQSKYYNIGIEKEFKLNNTEAQIISGWRELFYGDKNKSRYFWNSPFKYFQYDKRIPFAFILSYLPSKIVFDILNLNLKQFILNIYKYENTSSN